MEVYFTRVDKSDALEDIKLKLARLLEQSRLLDCLGQSDTAAIKMHFGEEGNTGYVRPEYVRIIYDAIIKTGARAFLSDTNTLYRGKRTNSQEHLKLAYEHGFTPDVVGAPVVIPDDTKGESTTQVRIEQRYVKAAKIATIFSGAQAIVGVSHFKGHMMSGFGGTLKNLGMGCATREGKLEQHSALAPFVIAKKCVGCQACVEVCPAGAIVIKNEQACLDTAKCVGCASCIAACTSEAIDVNWQAGAATMQEKMIEYALAVLKGKEGKRVFLNFALKITKECDCLAKDDPRIAPDIGIFASTDPVSVDKASMDLVNQACSGRDIFKKAHPKVDGHKQLEYACSLGLGSLDYELEEL